MFGFLKTSPLKKCEKERDVLVARAFQAQRNGNIRLYSTLTSEAEKLRERIETLKNGGNA